VLDDTDRLLFTVTDLKQYFYCHRIFYYQACLPAVRPLTYKMAAGIEAHESEPKRAARRSLNLLTDAPGQRHFDLRVQSDRLGLSGQIDEVIETAQTWIPVDYKLAKREGQHFRAQLAAYAMLLEETFNVEVKRGFLYLIPVRKTVEISITAKLRGEVEQALAAMRQIAERETMPPPTEWRQRCADCEFRRFCNDV